MNRTAFVAAAIAILALALGLRLFHASSRQSIWGDEAQEIGIIGASATAGELLDIVRQDGHPPLHYLIEWSLYRTQGASAVLARTHLVAFGTLGVALVMLLAYRCFGPRCALLTGLLAATAPFFVVYSTELRNYALFSALGPLFGLAYVRLLYRRDPGSALLWGAAGALLSLCHYYGLFVVFTSGIFVLTQERSRTGLLRVLAGAVAFLIVFAPWTPAFVWQCTHDLQAWARPQQDPRIILKLVTYPMGTAVAILLLTSLALGFAHIRRPERPTQERTAFLGLVFAAVGATVVAWSIQLFRGSYAARYLIAYTMLLLPAACLYASRMGTLGDVPIWRGLRTGRIYRLSQRWHGELGVTLLIVAALGFGSEWRRWGARRTSAVANCVDMIEARERPGDLIVASPPWTMLPLAHHYSGTLPICSPPYGEPIPWMDHLRRVELSRDFEAVRRQTRVLVDHLRSGGRIWVVVRRKMPVDPEQLDTFPILPESPSILLRQENRIHHEIMTTLYRHGHVGFRWDSRWDDFRYNASLLRIDPRTGGN